MRQLVVGDVTISVRTRTCADAKFPPVVLLAGTGATSEDWDTIADDLGRDRAVHAVDLPGHGRSSWPGTYSIDLMAQDVRALLPALGSSVDLVGHSLGGLVACKTAVASTAVRRLVLEDVGVLHPRPGVEVERPDGPIDFDWAVVEQVRPEIDDPDPGWALTFARIPVPTLVVSGGPESFVPVEHVRELAETMTDGAFVSIDAGHLIHATEPKQFIAATRSHLDRPGP